MPKKRPWPRRILRALLRALAVLLLAVIGYFGTAEAMLRFPSAPDAAPLGETPIHVYARSNGVHVDLWVPARNSVHDWSTWFPSELQILSYGYVGMGWGDEGFFLNVEEWSDLTAGVAIRGALLPSRAAMHVRSYRRPPDSGEHVHLLAIDEERYRALVAYIVSSFELNADGRPRMLDHPGYRTNDRFFAATGSYHMFRTCNAWTNEAVRRMGFSAPRWAPLERHVRYHLPKNSGR